MCFEVADERDARRDFCWLSCTRRLFEVEFLQLILLDREFLLPEAFCSIILGAGLLDPLLLLSSELEEVLTSWELSVLEFVQESCFDDSAGT